MTLPLQPTSPAARPLELVPRGRGQGYGEEDLTERRRWVEEKTAARLHQIGQTTIAGEAMRGNVENPIGAVQMPVGVAGPLLIDGEWAQGTFFVPLATTEGALVRSYERGMVVLTRSGGAKTRVWSDENRVSPIFTLDDVGRARELADLVSQHFDEIRARAESTTRHGRLLGIDCIPLGRQAILNFRYRTGDAQGMNMIVKATEHACRWILEHSPAVEFSIFSGYNSEKRAAGALLAGGKGKKVTAGARVPRAVARLYLRATPEEIARTWRLTVLGHLQAGSLGYNGHFANGLAATFIACGQDVANVANSAVGLTTFEVTEEGDLYAAVTLPSLSVATVGGGTALGTSRECLELLGCRGNGRARKLAEIIAAALLAGELSMAAAISSGELVDAHETYGRNRPAAGDLEGGE